MYDFAASWNPVQMQVNRLLKELKRHYDIENTWDPIDNSANSMERNFIQPGVLYKKFFTFKIPENMLDTECSEHNLAAHTRLPPSMGISPEELRQQTSKNTALSDFGFSGTSTSYGVLARFIGKASQYDVLDAKYMKTKLTDSLGDEYVIISQKTGFLRVVVEDMPPSEAAQVINREATRVLYDNLVNRIEDKIKKGRELQQMKAQGPEKFQEYLAKTDEHVHADTFHASHKSRQLYTRYDNVTKNFPSKFQKPKEYEISIPIQKNNILRGPKFQGMILVTSPRNEYLINYQGYGKGAQNLDSQLLIPMTVSYVLSENAQNAKIPDITRIDPELVVFTMTTPRRPIPIELHHDLLFKNKCTKLRDVLEDTFAQIVQEPMKQYGRDLAAIIRDVGADNLKLERSLQEDLVALSNSQSKENRLRLRESKLVASDGAIYDNEKSLQLSLTASEPGVYSRSFSLDLDALKAQKISLDSKKIAKDYCASSEICLVPSFQTCFLVRMYYLRLVITFSTGDKVELKLPASVVNLA